MYFEVHHVGTVGTVEGGSISGLGPACICRGVVDLTVGASSDLVAVSCISCVGRRSMLIAIPLSLVVYGSYNNRPGAT